MRRKGYFDECIRILSRDASLKKDIFPKIICFKPYVDLAAFISPKPCITIPRRKEAILTKVSIEKNLNVKTIMHCFKEVNEAVRTMVSLRKRILTEMSIVG